ncbi:MAG TPA: hypothetical protein VGX23_28890 [Actinocrinis sp.]|nr:hypothetical protein [Actinocrinis sp.]
MRIDELPMPARVAARPRDERGYPVPAITPWQDGLPQFALTSLPRTYICAMEHRCSICGDAMAPGPVWRVLAGPEADAAAEALAAGRRFLNRAPTAEAPGHRACMLYAAITCPYLARPAARRGRPVDLLGLSAERGGRRGLGGAVAAFEKVQFQLGSVVMFRFAGLTEFLQHDLGTDQSAALAAELAAADPEPRQPIPVYLLPDEADAQRRFEELRRNGPVLPVS